MLSTAAHAAVWASELWAHAARRADATAGGEPVPAFGRALEGVGVLHAPAAPGCGPPAAKALLPPADAGA
eukprot:1733440-Lingulodinium_polyedra.AAC.1